MANKNDKGERKSITVNVKFQGQQKGQELPPARAYLFDRAGRFLDSKLVDGKPLAFSVEAGPRYQFRVGPDLLRDQKTVPADLVAQLEKAKAISQDYIPAIHGDAVAVIVGHLVWPCWIFPTCINVHGTVRKLLNPGWACCWQELTEVLIQSDGSFSAEICFWCPADYPDLYFEVVQNIGGTEQEIYDPQIACSTYYN